MKNYRVYTATNIPPTTIVSVLNCWKIAEWNVLTDQGFRVMFATSEFHVLQDENGCLLSVARLNFSFGIEVAGEKYCFPEFVGFVSLQKGNGYGTQLLEHLLRNLHDRQVEAIGFCERGLRTFYCKTPITILPDKAPFLVEKGCQDVSDDDILCLNFSEKHIVLLNNLSENNIGYLVLE